MESTAVEMVAGVQSGKKQDSTLVAGDRPQRFVTAASLFDGHDVSINIIRRILQQKGAEVIHLGHNRSARSVVETAIQEDADAIALSSYQGGHVEYFKYVVDLLHGAGAGHIRVFGGGGGVIVPAEIAELEASGVDRIYSPDDGMRLGLEGMIDDMIERVAQARRARPALSPESPLKVGPDGWLALARALTAVEDDPGFRLPERAGGRPAPVVGITGTGGAGKSTLTDELIRRFLHDFPDLYVAVLSVDPTRKSSGGALLGDRIRMNTPYGASGHRVFMRSFATRQAHRSISGALAGGIALCRAAGYGLIFLETAGIGQGDTEVTAWSDLSIYVMTQEFGAPTQLEKIGMLEVADLVVLNKADKPGSEDALREIRKQVQRNRNDWKLRPEDMPVFPTCASHFGDPGVDLAFEYIVGALFWQSGFGSKREQAAQPTDGATVSTANPSGRRHRYLEQIVRSVRDYRSRVEEQVRLARTWQTLADAAKLVSEDQSGLESTVPALNDRASRIWEDLQAESRRHLEQWDSFVRSYQQDQLTYSVRGQSIKTPLFRHSLSGTRIPRVAAPDLRDAGDRLKFVYLENVPGRFPFTAGVFPLKRESEDPTRMFAGEGSPERTNRRFHLLSSGMPARRLSTAFDSVTLYGADPDRQPDIYGKIGNAGVSICTLDDVKKLYSGFNLCDPDTSVSMTINGPAPVILAMYLNAAIDQQVERFLKAEGKWPEVAHVLETENTVRPVYVPFGPTGVSEDLPPGHDGSGLGLLGKTGSDLVTMGLLDDTVYQDIKRRTLETVRGTVQADILKEDQAQNTCLFATDFALRLMADVQEYFIENRVGNYYSVSISGYHMAEAGANPITQLAFTLANGFTYIEYFKERGMPVDAFAPNLSFFFSNGMDAEYSVIGRVARRIWAIALRDVYGAGDRSQKLKYHIQTSGRSLHAKEIQFNDIRTTLQALTATLDFCNSLHTNAFDEAITTPTEESVRRALAIQLIINKEFGPAVCENPLQGSYFIEKLTDLVEEAVLQEFERLNDRGGVQGAMETRYQRSKIQDESMVYEQKKHTGELPIVGINTFVAAEQSGHEMEHQSLSRSSEQEKNHQIDHLVRFRERNVSAASVALERVYRSARSGQNVFAELMEAVKVCSLGQITEALFEAGGSYRRNV